MAIFVYDGATKSIIRNMTWDEFSNGITIYSENFQEELSNYMDQIYNDFSEIVNDIKTDFTSNNVYNIGDGFEIKNSNGDTIFYITENAGDVVINLDSDVIANEISSLKKMVCEEIESDNITVKDFLKIDDGVSDVNFSMEYDGIKYENGLLRENILKILANKAEVYKDLVINNNLIILGRVEADGEMKLGSMTIDSDKVVFEKDVVFSEKAYLYEEKEENEVATIEKVKEMYDGVYETINNFESQLAGFYDRMNIKLVKILLKNITLKNLGNMSTYSVQNKTLYITQGENNVKVSLKESSIPVKNLSISSLEIDFGDAINSSVEIREVPYITLTTVTSSEDDNTAGTMDNNFGVTQYKENENEIISLGNVKSESGATGEIGLIRISCNLKEKSGKSISFILEIGVE